MRRTTSSWLSTVAHLGRGIAKSRSRASTRRHQTSGYSRRYRAEQLENRLMLSVAPPEVVTVEWQGTQLEAVKDQWLVNFSAGTGQYLIDGLVDALSVSATLAEVSSMSNALLLEAPDVAVATVATWAAQFGTYLSVAPNAVSSVNAIIPDDPMFGSLWGLDDSPSGAHIHAPEAWEYTTGSRRNVIGVIDTGIDYRHEDLYLNIWVNQLEIPNSVKSQLVDVDGDELFTFVDFNDAQNTDIEVGGQSAFYDWNGTGYIDAGDLLNDGDSLNNIWEDGDGADSNTRVDDIVGWDFVNNDNDPLDDHYHGTHVAGTIGALGNNGVGVTGVNWAVSLVPLKVGVPLLDAQGQASIPESAAIAAIDYASALRTGDGNHVVATNNSWGGPGYTNNLKNAIDRADQASVLFIASAGNNNFNIDQVQHRPASFTSPNIISVASLHPNTGDKALSSNYGANSVDLAAPGVAILSTMPTVATASMLPPSPTRPPLYASLSGTSMAAPHVTGVAALLAAWNPNADAQLIKQVIMDSASFSFDFLDLVLSDGTVDAWRAMTKMPKSITVSTAVDEMDGDHSDGDLSLREALEIAKSLPQSILTIDFDPSLHGSTIVLAYDGPDAGTAPDQLTLTEDVTIVGPGANLITISGNNQTRVLEVLSGVTATIKGLSIASGTSSGQGGGILNSGILNLEDVVVRNSSAAYGGGIYNLGGLSMERSKVRLNSAGYGGGLYLADIGGGAILSRTEVDSNTAGGYGGGIYSHDGGLNFTDGTICNNSSGFQGGGVYITGIAGISSFYNSTISTNHALYQGGGIHAYSAWGADVNGSTITGNSTQYGSGGGIFSVTGGVVALTGTIVAGNTAVGGSDVSGPVVSGRGYNLIGTDSVLGNGLDNGLDNNQVGGEGGAPAINAMLAPLGNYGGPTRTHALLPGSPAIDKGYRFFGTGDQRGFPREIDDPSTPNGPNGAVDIGAFEFKGKLVVTTLADESDGNYLVDDISLREALELAAAIPGDDVIEFAPALFAQGAQTITLTYDGAEAGTGPDALNITSNVLIAGPGAKLLTISGDNQGRIFNVTGGVATIRDLRVTAGVGSAIVNSSNLTLQRVSIEDSTSSAGGAIANTGTLVIVDSTFSGNDAEFVGGAVFSSAGSTAIINSTLSSNEALLGGGVFLTGSGTLTVTNSTVTLNRADTGSGIFTYSGATLRNSIVAGNLTASGAASSNNVSGAILAGSANNLTSGDPLLSPLADNGGPTRTHVPLANSPVIDAGNNSLALDQFGASLTTDQRGMVRFVDDPTKPNVSGTVDLGAVEYIPLVVSTLVDELDGNFLPGDLSLREALTLAKPGDTITFASSLYASGPATIILTVDGSDFGTAPDQLLVDRDVTIDGPGANVLSISGNNQTGIFRVAGGVTTTIRSLTMKNGNMGSGGGISSQGTLTLDSVSIESCTATAGGGVDSAGQLTIINSTISGNHASYIGGGILLGNTTATIINSTISGNSGSGAIYLAIGALDMINCTVTQNVYGLLRLGGTATVSNSIFAENSTENISGAINVSTSFNNLVGSNGTGGLTNGAQGNIVLGAGQTAGLQTLAHNGGPTRTHALSTTSLAIGAGSNSIASAAGLTTDQRGFSRFVGQVDMGAYESAAPIVVSTTVDELDGNYAAGDLSLREALGLANTLPGSDTIEFAPSLTASGSATITLSYDGADAGTAPDVLAPSSNVVIAGPGANLLSVSGNNQTQVVSVASGVTATLRGLRITGGTGGIVSSGNVTLDRVAVENNSLSGVTINAGTLAVNGSTIANNNGSTGGGFKIFGGSTTIANSTISDNSASSVGGGMFAFSGTVQIVNSTITANRSNNGSGFYAVAPVTLHNSIVANNLTSTGAPTSSDMSGNIHVSSSYNLIGVGGGLVNGVNGNIVLGAGVSAGLSALGNYGGPTRTHKLLSTSAAIDAGDNAVAVASSLLEDQRGEDRIVDWDGVGGARVDIGAVELAFGKI